VLNLPLLVEVSTINILTSTYVIKLHVLPIAIGVLYQHTNEILKFKLSQKKETIPFIYKNL
jgi:hypothetical protein